MRKFVICVALVLCVPLLADGWGRTISWPGWTIQSGEGLGLSRRVHTGFPLTYLVDDDPNTAWVFGYRLDPHADPSNHHYVYIRLDQPRYLDELRIMSGYNKSQELFLRNDRATEIRLKTDPRSKETIRKVALSDRMGWHSVRLLRRKYEELAIVFTKLARGPDDDLCISGIELRDGGEKLEWRLPKWVMFDPGSDTGEDGHHWRMMSSSGKAGTGPRLEESGDVAWSPDGRYGAIAGKGHSSRDTLWVGDTDTGEVVYQWEEPGKGDAEDLGAKWTDDRHVELTWYDEETGRVLRRRAVQVR